MAHQCTPQDAPFSAKASCKVATLGQVQKQVWFDIGDDPGDAPSLPTALASFLGEDSTNEQINTTATLPP